MNLMNMRNRLFMLLLCVGFIKGKAQIGTFYTTDNELSSSLINSIYQDKRNYIWISTEDGLNKFDGVRLSTYKNVATDSTTIKNNYVRSLFEDNKNRFWVGCINALHIYNRVTDSFTEIPVYYEGARALPHVTSIIESTEGEIWMATSGIGVIRIKDEDQIVQTDESLTARLSSLHLTLVHQDKKGLIWIGSENQGLNCYNPVTDEVTIFKSPHLIGSNEISALCEDEEGTIFVGTLTNGLYKYDEGKQLFELIPCVGSSKLPVKSMLIDDQRRLLVGTDGQGIKIFNKEKQMLEDYQMQSAPFDFSKMKVHAICQDQAGNIWTGLFQKGVFLAPENPNKFEYWGFKSHNQNIIGSGCVMSLLIDKENGLWIGTDNDGIYRMNERKEVSHFSPNNTKNAAPNTVISMLEDERGNIWLGSYLRGLVQYDKANKKFNYFTNQLGETASNTAHDKIFSMIIDDNNQLWVGTNGAGLYVFDLDKKEYIQHYSQYNDKDQYYITNDWINCLYFDPQGVVWIGSYNGICSLDIQTNQLKEYSNILPGNIVYSIYKDSKQHLWIGTTEGLTRLNTQTGESKIYLEQNGLPGNVICGIMEDEEGNIWLSTHSGISKLMVEEERFINYYASDGLQGNEFSMGAHFKAKDGRHYFGGISGVTAFYPNDINTQRTPLNLQLTGLYVLNKPVVAGQKSGNNQIINEFISDVDTIQLSYNDNVFALEFSTFDFGFAERISYRYMLEGFNSHWLTTEPGENRINFTNITYGTYHLRVKASIYDSLSDEKLITLIISPPWYHTWWARISYFALFILLTWGVIRFMLDRIQHKNELLKREHAEQISEAKLQFFINVSHEIRTPMTLIISPLEKLISENSDTKVQKTYLLMYRNAQRILRLINQLMDVRKLDKGLMSVAFRETDIIGFIDDLMLTFEYQANKHNIDFKFIHQHEKLNVWVDLGCFDKVLVNILSNAFKFTPENGEITVILNTGHDDKAEGALSDYYEIIVTDTGDGIEEGKIEQIFERFYQINNNLNVNFGTGIGLHLARSLVELQHGILFARNKADKQGSEFVIRMPLGNSHISDVDKEADVELTVKTPTKESIVNTFPEVEQEQDTKPKSKTKYRILIVDDEEEIRQYIKSELSDMYRITEITNGKEALDYILKEKPDLVISDVMMPEMDGTTLTRKIKSNINVNHIPIILLTAKASQEDKAEAFETGADAYVPKPFNIDLLRKRIANILENRERLKHRIVDKEENETLIKPVVLRSSDQILYEKIIKIINENIADPDLNVEFLANGVGMSRVHMHRKLKELTNQSARDFIKSIRLKQAGELLAGQKLTVSEVAYALGFNNLSHFSNSFRGFHGMSPKEYAEKHRKTNE